MSLILPGYLKVGELQCILSLCIRLWHFWSGNVATKWCCSQTYPVNKVYKMTGNRLYKSVSSQ